MSSSAYEKDPEGMKKLDSFPQVLIDVAGKVFKYILIDVKIKDEDAIRTFVRGFEKDAYHGDTFDDFKSLLKKTTKLVEKVNCVGGGRINHEEKKITIYGYSQGYGRADHQKSASLVQKAFPDKVVEWNNDGY